jgi:hypothetical protein
LNCAFDPALLLYDAQEWLRHEPHCDRRMEALIEHRDTCARLGGQVALTQELQIVFTQQFPWNAHARVPQVRDLVRIVMDDLQRARFVQATDAAQTSVSELGALCQFVDMSVVAGPWKGLLGGLVKDDQRAVVATWTASEPPALRVRAVSADGSHSGELPIVWNAAGWAQQMGSASLWPDLTACVALFVEKDQAWRALTKARTPRALHYSDSFVGLAERELPSDSDRGKLIKCLAKLMFNQRDEGLHDESVRDFRRCRVTISRRLHYRETGDVIQLLKVGPHRLDGVD